MLIFIILLIIFLIFWFYIRPSQIRSECLTKVKEEVKEGQYEKSSTINNRYRICLVEKGLKPENLLSEIGE